MRNKLKIIKNRSDIGAGTRGADMGIDAMEIAAINNNNDFFNSTPFVNVDTHNETVYNKVKTSSAQRIQFVTEQCRRVATVTRQAILNNELAIVLSGDHSSALGTISGVKSANPDNRLGVIWIDAHADLHSPYTTPSGNIHGMPLAAALQLDNLKMKINDISDETKDSWIDLKNIGTFKPKILSEDLVFFGVRDTEEAEDYLIKAEGIKNYTVPEIRFRGLEKCLSEAVEKLKGCDIIYISFDVDSLDCDFVSKGTGTPVSFGFSPDEVKRIINGFNETGKVVCLEVVEVNPLLDNKGNLMAETAFDILYDCLS